jgi:hypothetical protein
MDPELICGDNALRTQEQLTADFSGRRKLTAASSLPITLYYCMNASAKSSLKH